MLQKRRKVAPALQTEAVERCVRFTKNILSLAFNYELKRAELGCGSFYRDWHADKVKDIAEWVNRSNFANEKREIKACSALERKRWESQEASSDEKRETPFSTLLSIGTLTMTDMATYDKRVGKAGCMNAETLYVLEKGSSQFSGMERNNNSLALNRKSHSLSHKRAHWEDFESRV